MKYQIYVKVLTMRFARCTCDIAGHNLCESGIEPEAPSQRYHDDFSDRIQLLACWRLSHTPLRFIYQRRILFDQISFPVKLLNLRVQLAVLFGKFIDLFLHLANIDRRDEFNFRTAVKLL